ncbi:MAG TPA: nuclear transport factor 2 family protein [Acidobacteriota bacterium]|nr:nuclear transport factor 2 family protein [Acidobacteriota bacterium]HNG95896.1 nuclear transport factor 2 family protein [Acidobacteriota bacterium]
MNNVTELVDRYIQMCNETDRARRQELIAGLWTETCTFADPMGQAEGQAGLDAMAQGLQDQFPGLKVRRISDVDAHHNRFRFAWEFGPEGGAALAGGVDFGVIVDNRLASITGFFDFAPELAAGHQ